MDDKTAEAAILLGNMAFKFAAVNRVPLWPDGATPESDTDHTVMLGLIGCAVAAKCDPTLDVGKVAQFSLVHDLVEVYAGDTNTFGMVSEQLHTEKAEREAAALARIEKELAELPWIAEMIHKYESLTSPEARFVKTMDKTLPKIARIVNSDANRTNPEEFLEHCAHQRKKLQETYASDQHIALALYDYLTSRAYEVIQKNAT